MARISSSPKSGKYYAFENVFVMWNILAFKFELSKSLGFSPRMV